MEKNRFQLGNGLELRVEPSFCYRHCGETGIPDAGTIVQRIIELPVNLSSHDLSLYKEGKLCLSPLDDYYDLQSCEKEINRNLTIEEAREAFIPIIQRLTESLPNNLIRSYEIFNADTIPIDLEPYLQNQKNFLKNRQPHPKGCGLFGDFSLIRKFLGCSEIESK